jgi:hypothetical protein
MGFIRRPNIRNTDVDVEFTKWINNDILQNIALSSGLSYVTDHHQVLQTRDIPLQGSATFRTGDQVRVGITRSYEFVPDEDSIRDIQINAGAYDTWSQHISFDAYRARRINGGIEFEWGELFDGTHQSAQASGSAKISNHLNIDLAFTQNHLDLKNGSLKSRVLSTRWTYSFTPDFFAKAYIQWNTADERFSGNIVVDWAYRPRSHIYLVYNENQDTFNRRVTDRIFMMKWTYLWQI